MRPTVQNSGRSPIVPRCCWLIVAKGTYCDFAATLADHSSDFTPVMLPGAAPFVMLYTSGTTGRPKGVRWPLRLLLQNAVYMHDAVDLRPDDHFWNVADPGWAYGLGCGVLGPLQLGNAITFFEGNFTVDFGIARDLVASDYCDSRSAHRLQADDGSRRRCDGADRGSVAHCL